MNGWTIIFVVEKIILNHVFFSILSMGWFNFFVEFSIV